MPEILLEEGHHWTDAGEFSVLDVGTEAKFQVLPWVLYSVDTHPCGSHTGYKEDEN